MHAVAHGEPVAHDLIEPMRDSRDVLGDPAALQQRMNDDGYLLVSNFFDGAGIEAARAAIFGALAGVGEIAPPAVNGIYSGSSRRREQVADLGEFWRSVSESWALRRLSHGTDLHAFAASVLGAPSRAQDYVFLRPANPGKFTHLHCDAPFFTRQTPRVLTVWIALGDVPLRMGPLFVVKNSHRDPQVAEHYRDFDVALDKDKKAALELTPAQYARSRDTTLLVREFGAGDVVVFGMYTVHGTFDNVATDNRCRLSCDVRYQPAADPVDPRYFGPDPAGTTGKGYGELVGAKPLNEPWHVR